jgi:hypothetical protein
MEWMNGIKMTEEEEIQVKAVRAAGCRCELPLLGYIPNQGPRCRMCGVEVHWTDDAIRREYEKGYSKDSD